MKTQERFLAGLGTGAVVGLLLTARMWKSTKSFPTQRCAGVEQVASVGSDGYANQIPDALNERCNQAENQLTSAMTNLATKLLQESEERWFLSFNENQRSVAADLRRLRMLVIWTVVLSCFGVVSFAIVLFLAYVKY